MNRPSWACVDLDALRKNYEAAQRMHGERVLAVLKANAYGHGAVRCAQALEDIADGFAVAFLSEALELRAAGITSPILLLEGVFDEAELKAAAWHSLWVVVHQETQLRMIENAPDKVNAMTVWLKMESGMGRAGFAPHDMASSFTRLKAAKAVGDIVLISHFACADEPENPATAYQIRTFNLACKGIDAPRSLANSAGILAWPEAHQSWGRAGIMLYGAHPLPAGQQHAKLRPVMTLRSTVFAERVLEPGTPLGYGGSFVSERRTRVGLVAVGYADGYPRTAPSGTAVAVDGQRTGLIGRVSMDMLTVDLTDLPDARVGSQVELWGPNVDINLVAAAAGTIAYELLCNVKRVPLIYSAPVASV